MLLSKFRELTNHMDGENTDLVIEKRVKGSTYIVASVLRLRLQGGKKSRVILVNDKEVKKVE